MPATNNSPIEDFGADPVEDQRDRRRNDHPEFGRGGGLKRGCKSSSDSHGRNMAGMMIAPIAKVVATEEPDTEAKIQAGEDTGTGQAALDAAHK